MAFDYGSRIRRVSIWLGAAFLLFLTASVCCADGAPRRIVSVCLQGDQLLLQLVPRERILALSQFAADPDLSVRWRQARDYPVTHGRAEELARLKPDLILVSSFNTQVPVELLKRSGIPVVELGIPNDFDELRAQIRFAGKCLDNEARAEEIIRSMDERLERLKARRLPDEARPTALIYFHDGFTPGTRTFAHALLEAAGFRNLGAGSGSPYGAAVSLESVLMARPKALIVTRYREGHPVQAQFPEPLLRKLGASTKIIPVSFRQLASPDPENLEFSEMLQQSLLQ